MQARSGRIHGWPAIARPTVDARPSIDSLDPPLAPNSTILVCMFAEGGMEIYGSMGTAHVAEKVMADGGKVQSLLAFRKIEEQFHRMRDTLLSMRRIGKLL